MARLRLSHRDVAVAAGAAAAALAIACGPKTPSTDAERLSRGREIVERMSRTLEGAKAFSVTTAETRQEIGRNGPRQVTLTRVTSVRRPDRLHSRVTGDRRLDVWYDGAGITLALHEEKVFGQARAPETLDKTLDAIEERYGFSAPTADYVYSSPAKALLTELTTGGWVGRETIDGEPCDHLSFRDTGVQWELWMPVSGAPLPKRAAAMFSQHPRLKTVDVAFKQWNLNAQLADEQFKPAVPADYEGVAMLQRARILRNVAPESGAQP